MTVYVDDMYRYPIGQFGRMKMSHLIADTREELFACVDAIGVKRKWIQKLDTYGEHFDIAMGKRLAAVKAGAVPILYRQCGMMCWRRLIEGKLGTPDEAEAWFALHHADRRIARYPPPAGAPAVVLDATPSGGDDLFHSRFTEGKAS